MSTRTIQVQPKTLQGNINNTDTQFIIEDFVGLDGLVILQADIGGVNDVLYGTFEPNSVREEGFSAKILSNSGTTVTFECTRGLLGKHPYGTGGIAYPHDAGSKIVFSNNPNLFNKFIAKDNTEVVTGDIQVPTPVGVNSVVPKEYVDDQDDLIDAVIAGLDAANVKLTGNQTIDDVKTFSSSPIVPAPLADFEAATKKYADDLAIAGSPDSSTSVKGIGRVSVAPASPTTPIFVGDNDPRVPTANPNTLYAPLSSLRFGGNGSDGALSSSSGMFPASINLGGAQVVVKNYSSISITGTGTLTFSNPHPNGTVIILKSQGNVTLTSSATPMIDLRNLGASGTNIASCVMGDIGATANGANGFNFGSHPATSNAGTVGTTPFRMGYTSNKLISLNGKFIPLSCGSAGSNGGQGGNNGGAGGTGSRGAGALLIECGGAWNFTTANGINVGSDNAGNGSNEPGVGQAAGGGAGSGAGGTFVGLYNTLTANTGTVVTAAGTAGNAGAASFSVINNSGGAGGSGGSNLFGSGTVGQNTNTRNDNGPSIRANGGVGANGLSLITSNTEFA